MVATGNKVIVDSGPLVGFLDSGDQWHAWAKSCLANLPCPLLTCESVLSEASYLLGGHDGLLEMTEMGVLEIMPIFPTHNARVRVLMQKYAPRMQLADACLVRLSELYPTARVLTTDAADFRLYRRNRTERIPLLLPATI